MNPDFQKQIIQLALENKLFSPEQLRQAEAESIEESPTHVSGESFDLIEQLIVRGIVDRKAIEKLKRQILDETSGSQFQTVLTPYKEESGVEEDIPETFGRYQRLEFLGKGGMAKVYKAYDPTLDRIVVLKFVRVESPELADRLMREAKAQARIDHEHVCKVFEVGQIDGRNYIAMQFIPGKTLKQAYKDMTPIQKVRVIQQVAEAIQEAHRAGLVHRDLKPANIMIFQKENGDLVPFVMDFGLAREVEGATTTASGIVIGTPAYMSPEQAAGSMVDNRSDVYSIGTTLYELFTGRVPFEEEGMVALINVIQKDPASPRKYNPTIPQDLETIILKAMEKEPHRRYESARGLAEDLGRYLDGSPVLARRASWMYRTSKKIRKYPVASTFLALGILVVLSALTFAVITRWEAREQTRFANEFGMEVEDIQQRLRYFYSQPPHDVRKDEETIREKLRGIESGLKTASPQAQGPGKYALGAGYLALGQDKEAKTYLSDAWNRENFQVPQVAYAFGLSLAHAYGKGLDEAEQIQNPELRAARIKEIEKEYRDPAVELVAKGRLTSSTPSYVEALIAYLERRYPDALVKTKDASLQSPWLYETDILRGDIYVALAKKEREAGNSKESLKMYREAEKNYSEAIRKAPSDLRTHLGMAAAQIRIMTLQEDMLNDLPQEAFEKGKAACETALLVHPNFAESYLLYGRLFYSSGRILYQTGKDYIADIHRSAELAQKALSLDPDADANYLLARIYIQIGTYKKEHGEDPVNSYQQAVSYVQKAISLKPNTAYLRAFLGAAYTYLAHHEMSRGQDARKSVDQSIESYQHCSRIDPRESSCFGFLGITYSLRAQLEAEQGKDPRGYFTKAIQTVENAIRLNPSYPTYYNYMGAAYYWTAEYEGYHGLNPEPSLNKAIAAYKQILQIQQEDPEGNANLCEAYNLKYKFESMIGINGAESVQQAISYGEQAVRISPDLDFSVLNLGVAYANLAEQDLKDNRKFSTAMGKSGKALQDTLKINPQYPEAYFTLGRLDFLSAKEKVLQRFSPIADLGRARVNFAKALHLNPAYNDAHHLMMETYRLQIGWKLAHKENPDKEIEEAISIAQKVTSQNPIDAVALAEEGALLFLKGSSVQHSQERAALETQSAEFLKRAFEINANLKSKYSNFKQPILVHENH